MAKSVMIDESLFIEICKFFLVGEQYSDRNLISEALRDKLSRLEAREAYAHRLQKRRPDAGV